VGPVWIQSIFGVLQKYHGFTKYFGIDTQGGVWMLKNCSFENYSVAKTTVFLEFRKLHPDPLFLDRTRAQRACTVFIVHPFSVCVRTPMLASCTK
jgi:hypothetical protein